MLHAQKHKRQWKEDIYAPTFCSEGSSGNPASGSCVPRCLEYRNSPQCSSQNFWWSTLLSAPRNGHMLIWAYYVSFENNNRHASWLWEPKAFFNDAPASKEALSKKHSGVCGFLKCYQAPSKDPACLSWVSGKAEEQSIVLMTKWLLDQHFLNNRYFLFSFPKIKVIKKSRYFSVN